MTTTQESATVAKLKTVLIDRTFNLPTDVVWKAWTDQDTFKKWWGPKDFTCPYASIDLKVGGKYLNCMKTSDGKEYWGTGTYKEIIPKKKLVYSDHFADSKGNVITPEQAGLPGKWGNLLVTLTFEETGGKTKMVLNHEGIPAEMHDDCEKGWQESFDKLEKNVQ